MPHFTEGIKVKGQMWKKKTLYSITKKNKMDPVAFYFSNKQNNEAFTLLQQKQATIQQTSATISLAPTNFYL